MVFDHVTGSLPCLIVKAEQFVAGYHEVSLGHLSWLGYASDHYRVNPVAVLACDTYTAAAARHNSTPTSL
jgi:hypothetical protein